MNHMSQTMMSNGSDSGRSTTIGDSKERIMPRLSHCEALQEETRGRVGHTFGSGASVHLSHILRVGLSLMYMKMTWRANAAFNSCPTHVFAELCMKAPASIAHNSILNRYRKGAVSLLALLAYSRIAWPCAGDDIFKSLPYQLSMVRDIQRHRPAACPQWSAASVRPGSWPSWRRGPCSPAP